jgi:hypothetical protein
MPITAERSRSLVGPPAGIAFTEQYGVGTGVLRNAGACAVSVISTQHTHSDQYARVEAATLAKAKSLNPRLSGIELAGSHDLAGNNPEGLAAAVSALGAVQAI